MLLLAAYVVLVVVGETIAVFIGLYLDGVAPSFSLPIALTLFFSILALAWPLAVRWTEPRASH